MTDLMRVSGDPYEFWRRSVDEGWGDGLPLLPATPERVAELVDAAGLPAGHVVAELPPVGGELTVELAAVNAALAGVEPAAFGHLLAIARATAVPDHNLFGLTTTTSSVCSSIIVNGPSREALGFDMAGGCMGGAAGRGSSTVGRAFQLCLRNVGGQRVPTTSKSVFGQPARSSGLCFAEWEERSPWAPLAERLGCAAGVDAVTVHGSKGTSPLADVHVDDARELAALIGRAVAQPLGNKYLQPSAENGEIVLVINPIWAERFGRVFPDVADLQVWLHENAWQPVDLWPPDNRALLEERGRVDDQGRVALTSGPHQFVVLVAGGLGSLHTIWLPTWGESTLQCEVV